MFNISKMWLMRYTTAKVATLDSITHIVFSHTRCPHLMLTQGHYVSVSALLLLAPLHAVNNVYGQRKIAMCLVVCGNKIVSEQGKCRNEFRRKPFCVNNVCHWSEQFKEAGGVCQRESSGRPAVKEENVERIRRAFLRSPWKSILRCSLELYIPKSAVHNVLHKKLTLHVYKIQLFHEIGAADKPLRNELAELEEIDNEPNFMQNIMFTNMAHFHINGCINQCKCQIWGSEKPHVTHEFTHDSTKLNRCELMHDHIFGLFAFAEKETINGMIFLDVLESPPPKFMIYPMLATFIYSWMVLLLIT